MDTDKIVDLLASLREFRREPLPEENMHPESELLVSLAEGNLESDQARDLRLHLLWCDDCSTIYFRLVAALEAARFWEGLRETALILQEEAEERVPVLAAAGRRHAVVPGSILPAAGEPEAIFLRVLYGPELEKDGAFRLRLALPPEQDSFKGTALVRLEFRKGEGIYWEEEVEDGIIECERDFGPGELPENVSEALFKILRIFVSSSDSPGHRPLTGRDQFVEPKCPGLDKLRKNVRKHVLDDTERWAHLLGSSLSGHLDDLRERITVTEKENNLQPPPRYGEWSNDSFAEWWRCVENEDGLPDKVDRVANAFCGRLAEAVREAFRCPRYATEGGQNDAHWFVDHAGLIVVGKLHRTRTSFRLQIFTGFRRRSPGSPRMTQDWEFFREACRYVVERKLPVPPVDTASPPYFMPKHWRGGII